MAVEERWPLVEVRLYLKGQTLGFFLVALQSVK